MMCNILDHRKIKILRKEPEGNTLVLLWLLMLAEAGKCNRGGYLMISDSIPYTDKTLSMVTDIPLPTVQLGLAIFGRLEMIDQQDGAFSSVTGVSTRAKINLKNDAGRIESGSGNIVKRSATKSVPFQRVLRCHVTVTLASHVTSRKRTDKARGE